MSGADRMVAVGPQGRSHKSISNVGSPTDKENRMSRMPIIARLLLPLAAVGASLIVVQPEAHATPVVVSQVAENGTEGYLQVDGKPFTINGVQSFGEWQTFGNGETSPIPTDQSTRILPQDWLENTFEKTSAAGFGTIQIELAWNQIEPTTQGMYD